MPALNDLLAPFGVAFGDAILEGQLVVDTEKLVYASGANIVRFPAGGHLHAAELADKATAGTKPGMYDMLCVHTPASNHAGVKPRLPMAALACKALAREDPGVLV